MRVSILKNASFSCISVLVSPFSFWFCSFNVFSRSNIWFWYCFCDLNYREKWEMLVERKTTRSMYLLSNIWLARCFFPLSNRQTCFLDYHFRFLSLFWAWEDFRIRRLFDLPMSYKWKYKIFLEKKKLQTPTTFR